MQDTKKHEFKDNLLHFEHNGATVEVRRYAAPKCWEGQPCVEGWQYFIAINGDNHPAGVPYFRIKHAIGAAKRRVDKGDFESSELFLKFGSFSVDNRIAKETWENLPVFAEACASHSQIRIDSAGDLWRLWEGSAPSATTVRILKTSRVGGAL